MQTNDDDAPPRRRRTGRTREKYVPAGVTIRESAKARLVSLAARREVSQAVALEQAVEEAWVRDDAHALADAEQTLRAASDALSDAADRYETARKKGG